MFCFLLSFSFISAIFFPRQQTHAAAVSLSLSLSQFRSNPSLLICLSLSIVDDDLPVNFIQTPTQTKREIERERRRERSSFPFSLSSSIVSSPWVKLFGSSSTPSSATLRCEYSLSLSFHFLYSFVFRENFVAFLFYFPTLFFGILIFISVQGYLGFIP